jgi:hypothetical protein
VHDDPAVLCFVPAMLALSHFLDLVERHPDRHVGPRQAKLGENIHFELPPARIVAIEEDIDGDWGR